MKDQPIKNAAQIAARLIANGYRPVPCNGKRVYVDGWPQRDFAECDFSPQHNVGIKTGQGIAFVDIDITDPDASAAITAEWLRRHPEGLRRTGLAPKTGFLVASDYEKKREVKFPQLGEKDKIEILADGQQFVAYGIHPDTGKPYHWHDLDPLDTFLGVTDMLTFVSKAEIDDFLQWADENFGPKHAPKLSEQAMPGGPAACHNDLRDDTFAGVNSTCSDEVAEILSHIPPDSGYSEWLAVLMGLHEWSSGSQEGLAIADAWSSRGSKYKPGEVAQKWKGFDTSGGSTWKSVTRLARLNGADLSAIARQYKGGSDHATSGRHSAPQGQDDRPPARPKQPAAAFQFVPVADLKYRAPDYIIGELIETDTLGLMFGDPGCGKSFLAVDIALSVATGTPFHGRDTKQGAVFFIAGEGHNGLARRFAAWSQARDVPLAGVPLFKSERAAQFLDGASAKAVADAVAGLAAQHGSPALIIIDTLARNFGAGDENNTSDMSEFVVAVDDLKARFLGCSVLIVHHSGHAAKERARGAMALKGALDCEYRVEKEGHAMKLVNTKMKDAEPPQDVYFSFKQVDLDGIAQSAVLEATEAPERQHKLTPTQRLAQETYITAAAQNGSWVDGMFIGVQLDDWRKQFYQKHTGDNPNAKRQAFNRVRNDLAATDTIAVENDLYLWRDTGVQVAVILQRDKRDIALQSENCNGAEAGNSVTCVTNA
jgi:hypothetical protein